MTFKRRPLEHHFQATQSTKYTMASLETQTPQFLDLEPCNFPQLNKAFVAPDERLRSRAELLPESRTALQEFSKHHGVTLESVIQTAWALTLRAYLGSDKTLFGYENDKICGNQFDVANTILQHVKRSRESGDASTSMASWWSVRGEHIKDDVFNTVLVVVDCAPDTNQNGHCDSQQVCAQKELVEIPS